MGLLEMRNLLDVSESAFIFQGQVAISAKFDKGIYLPEDAEFYFVYDGSLKRHVMFAERISDNTLQSIVPGEHELLFTFFISLLYLTPISKLGTTEGFGITLFYGSVMEEMQERNDSL